ncbi:brg1-associated factor b [Coniophora puteana RWD-64-598 SS2]|uniref:Brg1-associated factor b n=1 Tax=Coniophora puteana (strain RWD-64-598) TaxID=741705 RepID=A0A5M3MSV0_CONPW|nr:brg1-associated factor b [Coniophora puteana RWD-64-598 SS2]EIW82242.1 brg1-associated factor b [Coniophora puteana RWD-64-598 SS2]
MVAYGGDEVSALVLDIGSSSIRAGYAGDDTPKAIVSSYYGWKPDASSSASGDVQMDEASGEKQKQEGAEAGADQSTSKSASSNAKLYLGQHGPSIWRHGMEVGNPLQDGLITDFNAVPALISHALSDVMRIDPTEHPALVTEPAWNTPANRERMAEIMFEEFQVPAFYIANTGVLNAFAAGKGSALVIDVGHHMASITPVVDGFVLRKGLVSSSLPKFVHARAHHVLTNPTQTRPGVALYPHQLILSKQPVEPSAPPQFTLREDRVAGTTDTWRSWYENKEVDEWIQTVAGVLNQGWNEQAAAARPLRQYEFPTGYNTYFGSERFQIGEEFFHTSPQMAASNPNMPKNIPNLLSESLRACDRDLRQVLLGNVVLTGGGSLFGGFAERLEAELSRQFTHIKIHAPGNPIERRYGGWLGGSILASLGTFHQLWISKEEWQEHGKAIVGQRCK